MANELLDRPRQLSLKLAVFGQGMIETGQCLDIAHRSLEAFISELHSKLDLERLSSQATMFDLPQEELKAQADLLGRVLNENPALEGDFLSRTLLDLIDRAQKLNEQMIPVIHDAGLYSLELDEADSWEPVVEDPPEDVKATPTVDEVANLLSSDPEFAGAVARAVAVKLKSDAVNLSEVIVNAIFRGLDKLFADSQPPTDKK